MLAAEMPQFAEDKKGLRSDETVSTLEAAIRGDKDKTRSGKETVGVRGDWSKARKPM